MPAYKMVVKIHGKIQYYTALLNVEAKFTGLKYYIHAWFYSSFFIITAWLTLIIFLIIITSFYDLKSLIFVNNDNYDKKHEESTSSNKEFQELTFTGKLNTPMKQLVSNDDVHLRFKENLITFKEYLKSNKQSID